jgi:hypothetical protein
MGLQFEGGVMYKITKLVSSAFLLGLLTQGPLAQAAVYDIDLSTVLQTGTTMGPCYCTTTLTYSPIFAAQAGDIFDFGMVEILSFAGEPTPDGGPNQQAYYVQGSPAVVFNGQPIPYPFLPYREGAFAFPTIWDLEYTVPAGADSIQVYWEGPYFYPPVPEISTWAMLLIGFAGIGFVGWQRTRLTRGLTGVGNLG